MNDKTIATGGSAFPSLESEYDGMSLRDYFAAKAMEGICAGAAWQDLQTGRAAIASTAYGIADEMLKARGK